MDLDIETTALIVVDVQWDFLPGGALPIPDGDAILAPLAQFAPRFLHLVATQDYHPPGHVSFASAHPGHEPTDAVELNGHVQRLWPDHCVAGTSGAALHPDVPDASVSLIVRKGTRRAVDSYSAFREQYGPDGKRRPTGLAGWLRERGIRTVLVVGLARDVCVRYTAIDAALAKFRSIVLDDLTREVWPRRRAETDADLKAVDVALARSDALRF